VGLREEKRQRQRAAIIENAVALFRESGFERTTVREVAERCRVSEATFFNYFPAKDAVLGAWACDALERAFADVAASAGSSLRPVVRGLARRLAAHVEEDRVFAAAAWGRVRLASLPVPAAALAPIERAQAEGELRRDVAAAELARLLVACAAATIARWLEEHAGDAAPAPDEPLEQRLRPALDLVLDGARRRHERVRPAARAAARPPPPVA